MIMVKATVIPLLNAFFIIVYLLQEYLMSEMKIPAFLKKKRKAERS